MTPTPESVARTTTLWSWAYRANPGMAMVAVAKLDEAELDECLEAAERLRGWVHLRRMVLQRERLASGVGGGP